MKAVLSEKKMKSVIESEIGIAVEGSEVETKTVDVVKVETLRVGFA